MDVWIIMSFNSETLDSSGDGACSKQLHRQTPSAQEQLQWIKNPVLLQTSMATGQQRSTTVWRSESRIPDHTEKWTRTIVFSFTSIICLLFFLFLLLHNLLLYYLENIKKKEENCFHGTCTFCGIIRQK